MNNALMWMFSRSVFLYAAIAVIFMNVIDFDAARKQRAKYLLGIFYNGHFQNYRDGIVYYDYLLSQKRIGMDDYIDMCSCYYNLKRYPKALSCYQKVLELNPGSAKAARYVEHARRKVEEGRKD